MVKLLITGVSYICEDGISDGNGRGRRKYVFLQKKGKWKSIAKVMAERGYHVSPQQCEDKFNDLNKRYKKLNDMLGRGTSCQVVENPALLDLIDYLSEKEKDDVHKILSSKHLFYEELALRNRDDHDNDDTRRSHHDDHDEDDQEVEVDGHNDFEENYASHGDTRGIYGPLEGSMKKKLKQCQGHEDASTFVNPLSCQDHNKHAYTHGQMVQSGTNQVLPKGTEAAWLQKQWFESHSLQLEEQKLQLQSEMLELEEQRLKWQRFSKKKEQELEKLCFENERLKPENEHISL
ncbi:hypothetical protein Lal_00011698 [Lupinus albus]|nr:hypothetical protein Lal_00011698 [Lupinus albus]